MTATLLDARVTAVHHWNERVFSFRTERDEAFRFRNGQFVMLGLEVHGRPLLRAYSIASGNHESQLEFLSIKVPDGPLTSRLQRLAPGDTVLLSRKPTGTLIADDLLDGERLFLFASGTGLAPFMAVVKDPEVYERFAQVVLVHGVREVSDLAYADFLGGGWKRDRLLAEVIAGRLAYVPTVTRERFAIEGRVPDLVESGRLAAVLGGSDLHHASDRAMLCGSEAFLASMEALLRRRGFEVSPRVGERGHYVVEKAFVTR